MTTSFWRQREIEQYLDNTNRKTIPWIALDDNAGDFAPGLPNLDLCNMTTGIDDDVETQLRFKLGAHGLESEYLDDVGNARASFANMNQLPSR